MTTEKDLKDIFVGVQRLITAKPTPERLMLAAGMLVSSKAMLTTLEDWQQWGTLATNLLYTLATVEKEEERYP